jgi:hypothetical protein
MADRTTPQTASTPNAQETRVAEPGSHPSAHSPRAGDSGAYEIHSEPHGPHWVAWISRAGETRPDRSVILVAQTREEAESRARRWADAQARRGSA